MAKIRLTQAAVEKVKPPPTGRLELFDTHLQSFGLRVSAGGHKAWFVFYRLAGKQRRQTLGTLVDIPKVEEARDRARDVLREVAKGSDPTVTLGDAADAAPLTFRELADRFVERWAKKRTRSWQGTKRILELHVLPTWGDRAAASITKKDVRKLLADLSEELPVGVNRVLATIRKLFNWAVEHDELPAAPTAGVKAPARETERERVLSDDEVAALWRATGAIGGAPGAFVRLLILTGQRRDEVAKMRWSDVDLDRKLWTVPREMTKSNRTHEVPLSDPAVEVLTALPRLGTYVLTTRGHRRKPGQELKPDRFTDRDRAISGYSKIKTALDAKIAALAEDDAVAAGDTGNEGEAAARPGWRFHDLRRTSGTGMARLGVPTSTISRVLNHKEGGVTKIYARYGYLDEKRDALDRWARHVDMLARPAPSNVVELQRA
jgi:integrase